MKCRPLGLALTAVEMPHPYFNKTCGIATYGRTGGAMHCCRFASEKSPQIKKFKRAFLYFTDDIAARALP
jgi:hypothetical protein